MAGRQRPLQRLRVGLDQGLGLDTVPREERGRPEEVAGEPGAAVCRTSRDEGCGQLHSLRPRGSQWAAEPSGCQPAASQPGAAGHRACLAQHSRSVC